MLSKLIYMSSIFREEYETRVVCSLLSALGLTGVRQRHGKDGYEPDEIWDLQSMGQVGIEITTACYDNIDAG